jgi:hypothetical protein
MDFEILSYKYIAHFKDKVPKSPFDDLKRIKKIELPVDYFQFYNTVSSVLLEKWFLVDRLGDIATSVQLEKNYFTNLIDYYNNLKKLGMEYDKLNYDNCLDFLLMTVKGLQQQ